MNQKTGNNENRQNVGNQTFIEINGKKYDTKTGKLLGNSLSSAQTFTVKPAQQTGSIDGFSRRPQQKQPRSNVNNLAKQPKKSQTLARQAVKRPSTPHSGIANQNQVHRASLKTPAGRLAHAQQVQKSPHINKFGSKAQISSITKRHTELAVRPEPTETQYHQNTTNHLAPAQKNHHTTTEKLIEAALSNADSHNNHHHIHKSKKRSKLAKKLGVSSKTIAMSSAVLAGVLLGGFFAIQNVPNLSMRVAATRAGFSASMPSYQPAGFRFQGPISYQTGQVTVTFTSNSDNRSYVIRQTNSNWNSDALLANFVDTEEKQYQTYVDRGRTLYIYNGSNATWVNDGIWYQIEGASDLTTDQLIRIASSI